MSMLPASFLRLVHLGVAGLVIALACPRVEAQPRSSPSPTEVGQALFDRGLELYERGDYDAAAEAFEAAYEKAPEPATLFAWAQAVRLSGDCEAALELYQRFLATDPDEVDEQAARKAMAPCAAQVENTEAHEEPETSSPEPERPSPEPGRMKSELETGPPPAPRPDVDPHTSAVTRSAAPTSRPRWSLFTRADIDGAGRGVVMAPGASVRLLGGWDVFAAGLVGGNAGAELGSRFAFGRRRVRPFAAVAVPVFFVDGARPGVRGSVGARIRLWRSLAAAAELGASHALSAPAGYAETVALGSITLELWM